MQKPRASTDSYGLLDKQQDADYARSLCISGTSMNLNMMNTKRVEANKLSRLNVRCVKNY